MGKFKDVIGSSRPCTSRGAASDATVLAHSQALLSLRLVAYPLLHVCAPRWGGRDLAKLELTPPARAGAQGRCPPAHPRPAHHGRDRTPRG